MSENKTIEEALLTEEFIQKWTQKKILHFDLDCFYAAVEIRDNPSLKGKPVGIGGSPESRSVLCTSNYEARKYGVRSAMSSAMAVRKCPQLILIPPNFKKYSHESKIVFSIFKKYSDLIEPLSLDEAFIDVTEVANKYGSASEIAKRIKAEVYEQTQLTISAGVSFNKFFAKVASDWKKPNGFFVIPPSQRVEFVKDLKIKNLFGIGKKTEEKLHELKIFTCSDIQKKTMPELKMIFGSRAVEMFYLSHGIDFREVIPDSERKSFSVEETFEHDYDLKEELISRLNEIYQEWVRRIQSKSEKVDLRLIKTAVVKVKYFDFKQITHECQFKIEFLNGSSGMSNEVKLPEFDLFEKLFLNIWNKRNEPIRLIGVGVRFDNADRFDLHQEQLEFEV